MVLVLQNTAFLQSLRGNGKAKSKNFILCLCTLSHFEAESPIITQLISFTKS